MSWTEEFTVRMADGSAEKGYWLLQKIGALAGATESQQQFVYRTVTLTPENARDFFAYLASVGIGVVAVDPDPEVPA